MADDEIAVDNQQQQEPSKGKEESAPAAAAAAAASSSLWGWGKWATPKLSVLSDLQTAAKEMTRTAMEAAKGVTSLQSNAHESPVSKETSTRGSSLEAHLTVTAATGEMTDSSDTTDDVADVDVKKREATLKSLEDASKDSVFGHGLKVLDDSVESLATGAWQALGTVWKGSVGFVQNLESSAENVLGTLHAGDLTTKATALAPTLIEGGKVLTARGIEMLEYVGRETMDILVSETGIQLEDDAKQSELVGPGVEDNDVEEITFDRCFYIYGGPEHFEELEALSSHHALLCNRARAKLPHDQRIAYDGVVKQIRELLTLNKEDDTSTDKGKKVEKESTNEANEIKALYDSSVKKAAELATGFTATIGGLAMAEVVQKTRDRLEAIKAEGIHRLSELCALCISHFVTLGKSLTVAKFSEDSESTDSPDAFEWPNDCVEKALYLRAEARTMVNDMEAVVESFITGIGDVTATFRAANTKEAALPVESDGGDLKRGLLGDTPVEEQAQSVTSSLESDGSTAIGRMQDGLYHLLHVVMYTSL